MPAQHGISMVMPILNEERHLAESVDAILAQDWSGPIEIILALGPSTDATDDVAAQLHAVDQRIKLVFNPSGRTPKALNVAIAHASHDIVCRVDGHGILSPDYLTTAVRTLNETGAANVGGTMDPEGTTDLERAVACAMKSKLGVGDVKFKLGGDAGPAETVYLGVFRRSWLERVGGYDERFSRAQDWEMNFRLRADGGVVWFTPAMRVAYRPRGTFAALAKQYREYGQWRRVLARQHKRSINVRYLTPPTALAAIAAGILVGFAWRPLWVIPATYAGVVTVGGVAISRGETPAVYARVPAVLATMHLSWGWGFLTSRIRFSDDVQNYTQQQPGSLTGIDRRVRVCPTTTVQRN